MATLTPLIDDTPTPPNSGKPDLIVEEYPKGKGMGHDDKVTASRNMKQSVDVILRKKTTT